MTRFALPSTILGGVVFALLQAAPAQAQATRTWVSGVGDDVNPCSRTAPCKTFAGAISKTAAGGMINCLDPGGYGAVTITKSITIKCYGTFGSILASSVNGVVINDSATGTPGTIKVVLSHLDIDGAGTTLGVNGIRFVSGNSLIVHAVQIRNFSANGIDINPLNNGSGAKEVNIADSYIAKVGGAGASNAAIRIAPNASVSVNVTVNNTQMEDNSNGIFMDGALNGNASNLSVKNSVMAGSTFNGIAVAKASGGAFLATVDNSHMTMNVVTGAAVNGASATLRLGASTIASNTTGVSNVGGTLQSFKNNQIAGNGTDGTPINAFPGPGGTALQ
jgi:hypothetical protein